MGQTDDFPSFIYPLVFHKFTEYCDTKYVDDIIVNFWLYIVEKLLEYAFTSERNGPSKCLSRKV